MELDPYEEIEKALEVLVLPRLIRKNDIKKQYYFLAKKNHPDIGGDEKRMEELNNAYKTLMKYVDGFCFSFTKDEIIKQFSGVGYAQQFKP